MQFLADQSQNPSIDFYYLCSLSSSRSSDVLTCWRPSHFFISLLFVQITDYGHPMKPFFIEIQNFWAWTDKMCKFWGICGIFGQFISTHFGTVSSLSIFSITEPLFLQRNKPLYPHLKYFFGIGILIWSTKNQGFNLRVSVVHGPDYALQLYKIYVRPRPIIP